MQSDAYKSAKKKGLLELLKQMHGLMSKGKGDKPIEGEIEIDIEAGKPGEGDEHAEHETCEHCEGEGCEHCEGESDEPADVNATAEDDGEDDEHEPDFKQKVRDFLSDKRKPTPAKRSLVVHQPTPKAAMPAQFQKGYKKRA